MNSFAEMSDDIIRFDRVVQPNSVIIPTYFFYCGE